MAQHDSPKALKAKEVGELADEVERIAAISDGLTQLSAIASADAGAVLQVGVSIVTTENVPPEANTLGGLELTGNDITQFINTLSGKTTADLNQAESALTVAMNELDVL
jgi:hypothetical protein